MATTTTDGRVTTFAWVILSVLTLTSYWLGPAPVASVGITIAVLALALVKSRLVIQYFMEVRRAPKWLQVSTDAWLIVLFATILAIYLY
ncbi:MAG: cytochrome C oxidase subunit IV family protein [Mycobacterium sp.]